MIHVAIMNPPGLIDKIVAGEKTIETRWYMTRRMPWNAISVGHTIYFKESGGPVRAKARVRKVEQFIDLDLGNTRDLLRDNWDAICPVAPFDEFVEWAAEKKYVLLIHLMDVEPVERFLLDKSGFGNAAAWLCLENKEDLKARKL